MLNVNYVKMMNKYFYKFIIIKHKNIILYLE